MKIDNLNRKEIIVHKVFNLFSNEEYEEGKNILLQLYNSNYEDIYDLKAKRSLIYSLAWVENKLGYREEAKKHIKVLRNYIYLDRDYMLNNMMEYCMVLNLYCELFYEDINKDLYIKYNKLIASYYRKIGSVEEESIALSNIYLVNDEVDKVIELLMRLIEYGCEEFCIDKIANCVKLRNSNAYEKVLKVIG